MDLVRERKGNLRLVHERRESMGLSRERRERMGPCHELMANMDLSLEKRENMSPSREALVQRRGLAAGRVESCPCPLILVKNVTSTSSREWRRQYARRTAYSAMKCFQIVE